MNRTDYKTTRAVNFGRAPRSTRRRSRAVAGPAYALGGAYHFRNYQPAAVLRPYVVRNPRAAMLPALARAREEVRVFSARPIFVPRPYASWANPPGHRALETLRKSDKRRIALERARRDERRGTRAALAAMVVVDEPSAGAA